MLNVKLLQDRPERVRETAKDMNVSNKSFPAISEIAGLLENL